MPSIENKDAVLFWLKRHEREVEARVKPPSQTEMAKSGVPYGERDRMVEEARKRAEAHREELQALSDAILFIDAHG